MKLLPYILPFINLVTLKDTWRNEKSGEKLIIEPSRITLKYNNNSMISVSKDLVNNDNCVKIKWVNMTESNLRLIDDKTIVLFDDSKIQLYKRNVSINNHIIILYLFQLGRCFARLYISLINNKFF